MNDLKAKQVRDLGRESGEASFVGTGCVLLATFLLFVAFGATLHMMSTSAGRSIVFQAIIWIPLLILGYYIFKSIRSFRRLPAQTDLEFSDRLRQRLEEEELRKKKLSTPASAPTTKKPHIDVVDLPEDEPPTSSSESPLSPGK